MSDILACDLPIRPIRPGDKQPAPVERAPEADPAPASFSDELSKMFVGLLGR